MSKNPFCEGRLTANELDFKSRRVKVILREESPCSFRTGIKLNAQSHAVLIYALAQIADLPASAVRQKSYIKMNVAFV